jgi:hypothetical protein
LIVNNSGDEIIVDDAVMKVAPPTTGLSVKYHPPTIEDVAAVEQARVELGKLQGPHDSPEPAAKRALESFRGRK